MTTFDDPLFAEDWAARNGYGVLRLFEPTFGERTWEIDDAALAAAKAHANIEGDGEDSLVRHYLESALEAIDGYDGGLGVILQYREVIQPFQHFLYNLPLIGPLAPRAQFPMTLRYRPYGEHEESDWVTVDESDYGIVRMAGGPAIRLRGRFHRDYQRAFFTSVGDIDTEPRVEVVYTAGFGANLSALPADLRHAVYVLARRAYDFRDDSMPNVFGGMTLGVRSILNRYRRSWQ